MNVVDQDILGLLQMQEVRNARSDLCLMMHSSTRLGTS